jgi:hypothetical protein
MLSLLLVGRKKELKKKRERNVQVAFFPGPEIPYWLCHLGCSQLLGAIKP